MSHTSISLVVICTLFIASYYIRQLPSQHSVVWRLGPQIHPPRRKEWESEGSPFFNHTAFLPLASHFATIIDLFQCLDINESVLCEASDCPGSRLGGQFLYESFPGPITPFSCGQSLSNANNSQVSYQLPSANTVHPRLKDGQSFTTTSSHISPHRRSIPILEARSRPFINSLVRSQYLIPERSRIRLRRSRL